MTDVRNPIRTFVTKAFRGRALQDGDDIFAAGFVNSLFAMQLVVFLEKHFQIRLENEDLTLSNLRTIDALAAMVERSRFTAADAQPDRLML